MEKEKTQCELIVDYIREHGSISNLEAITELSVGRLASRIYDLKKAEIPVYGKTVKEKNKNGRFVTYTRYYLAE